MIRRGSTRRRRCRPRISPAAGVYRIKDSQFRLVDGPRGVVQGIGSVFLGPLGFSFCLLDVALVSFAADAVAQTLRFRRGVGFHQLPRSLRLISDVAGLSLDGILTCSHICLGLTYARLNLLIRFRPGL